MCKSGLTLRWYMGASNPSPLPHDSSPPRCIHTQLSLTSCLGSQTRSADRSCRFPTSHWGVNIHPKELHIAVTPDDIMTTWKLINSFIHPKLSLLFISVTRPHPSLYFSSLPICHKFILLHLTSPPVLMLPINHRCCLTLSIFPETQGRQQQQRRQRLLQKLGQA